MTKREEKLLSREFFEKVNPSHPDKLADRLGGYCVDLAYKISDNPMIAGECLLGHETATILIETDLPIFVDGNNDINITSLYGFEERFFLAKKWIKRYCKDKERTADKLVKALEETSNFYKEIDKINELLWEVLDENKELFDEKTTAYHCWFILSIFLWINENLPSVEDIALKIVKQDSTLNKNARDGRVGDNGIFKGVPTSDTERTLTNIMYDFYKTFNSDGKGLIVKENYLIKPYEEEVEINQSMTQGREEELEKIKEEVNSLINRRLTVNPLGNWTGGLNVDSGATNRKLGSDMGRAVTGGGLHFKDLSKADVSVNIVCYLLAQEIKKVVTTTTIIGQHYVVFHINNGDGTFGEKTLEFSDVKEKAREYIKKIGGFEKLAEWGLIRPSWLEATDRIRYEKEKTDILKQVFGDDICEACKIE